MTVRARPVRARGRVGGHPAGGGRALRTLSGEGGAAPLPPCTVLGCSSYNTSSSRRRVTESRGQGSGAGCRLEPGQGRPFPRRTWALRVGRPLRLAACRSTFVATVGPPRRPGRLGAPGVAGRGPSPGRRACAFPAHRKVRRSRFAGFCTAGGALLD